MVRLQCVVVLPGLAFIDLLSYSEFAQNISCMERRVCEQDETLRQWYYVFAWRDLFGALFTVRSDSLPVFPFRWLRSVFSSP